MDANKEKIDNFIKKLNKKKIKCPLCHSDEFSVNGKIFFLQEFEYDLFSKQKTTAFPIITISCKNCGYTFLINAIDANLII